jgi:predicted sugar kinase
MGFHLEPVSFNGLTPDMLADVAVKHKHVRKLVNRMMRGEKLVKRWYSNWGPEIYGMKPEQVAHIAVKSPVIRKLVDEKIRNGERPRKWYERRAT